MHAKVGHRAIGRIGVVAASSWKKCTSPMFCESGLSLGSVPVDIWMFFIALRPCSASFVVAFDRLRVTALLHTLQIATRLTPSTAS